mmetsp:Transcript_25749/g.60990  ORF Transcript_25749/g.60990 Transcript_25749/m.60990 type:complete len:645 (+) Transcript_25749:283-2217(+)
MPPDAGNTSRRGRFLVTPLDKTTTTTTTTSAVAAGTTTTTTTAIKTIDEEDYGILEDDVDNDPAIECVLENTLTDFSLVEQPIRCRLEFGGRNLSFNGRTAVFLATPKQKSQSQSSALDEFVLVPCTYQYNGNSTSKTTTTTTSTSDVVECFFIMNSKTKKCLCAVEPTTQEDNDDIVKAPKKSNKKGISNVYASETHHPNGLDKWIISRDRRNGLEIRSAVDNQRCLVGMGSTVHTCARHATENTSNCWNMHFLSGELCFLSLPALNSQVRCDMVGSLSLSGNFQGWEVWQMIEVGDGSIRLSPWAHADTFLSSDSTGKVYTTGDFGPDECWNVQKAPNGLYGMIFVSAVTGRVLRYDVKTESFITTSDTAGQLDEACVFDFSSAHRNTYFFLTKDKTGRKLEASKKGLTTRKLPGRLVSEEWTIEETNEYGVLKFYSNAREQYLSSDDGGEVFLTDVGSTENENGSTASDRCLWTIEERDEGFVVLSKATQRVLVAPNEGPIKTVPSGTVVKGSTRWMLEPRMPRQVNKEKMAAVGTAVGIGVATTVATPFIIGAAVGIMGVAQVGIAGQVAIGGIRAAEALSTITRVTCTSSQLVQSQSEMASSRTLSDSLQTGSVKDIDTTDIDRARTGRRLSFSSWRKW